jgi:hypothetical protein
MIVKSETIYCEVCRLPHRRGVVRCEDCGHQLGSPPDWEGMRETLRHLRVKITIGIVALVAMLVGNFALFGGAGFIILTAPIGWTVFGVYRYRVISRRLRALPTY